MYAFEEICPERIDLIHKHYRKLCQVMADVDEWGQVMIINLLTRYARTQFTDPNIEVCFVLNRCDAIVGGQRARDLRTYPSKTIKEVSYMEKVVKKDSCPRR